MSDNPHKNLGDILPLSMYGEMILEAYRKMGLEVVVSIHVGNPEDGAVTGTSNMSLEAEHHFIEWILEQRIKGGVTHEKRDYADKANPKEKLN